MDQLSIVDLPVECIIGILPREREHKQPLRLDVTFHLTSAPAAESTSMRDAVDYAALSQDITFILEASRFHLIESAAEAVAAYALHAARRTAPRAHAEAVTVHLKKPQALGGQGFPALRIERRYADMRFETEEGRGEVLFRCAECDIVCAPTKRETNELRREHQAAGGVILVVERRFA